MKKYWDEKNKTLTDKPTKQVKTSTSKEKPKE